MGNEELVVNFLSRNGGDRELTVIQVRYFLGVIAERDPSPAMRHRAREMLGFLYSDGHHFCGVLYIYAPGTNHTVIGYNPRETRMGIGFSEYLSQRGWGVNDD